MKPDDVVARVTSHLFGSPIIQNDVRGAVVEAIVAAALEPDWELCSEGWSGWDLQNPDRLRIQVRNSAALQSWGGEPKPQSFSIAPSKGYFLPDGTTWVDEPGRHAEIYVLAWHPVVDDTADHRDPSQWWFYVIDARDLPDQGKIRQTVVHRRWGCVTIEDLPSKVMNVASEWHP